MKGQYRQSSLVSARTCPMPFVPRPGFIITTFLKESSVLTGRVFQHMHVRFPINPGLATIWGSNHATTHSMHRKKVAAERILGFHLYCQLYIHGSGTPQVLGSTARAYTCSLEHLQSSSPPKYSFLRSDHFVNYSKFLGKNEKHHTPDTS